MLPNLSLFIYFFFPPVQYPPSCINVLPLIPHLSHIVLQLFFSSVISLWSSTSLKPCLILYQIFVWYFLFAFLFTPSVLHASALSFARKSNNQWLMKFISSLSILHYHEKMYYLKFYIPSPDLVTHVSKEGFRCETIIDSFYCFSNNASFSAVITPIGSMTWEAAILLSFHISPPYFAMESHILPLFQCIPSLS